MTTAQPTVERYTTRLERTLPALQDRIERATSVAGRSTSSVRLVAVTKAHPLAAIEAALVAGLVDLGENRVQELSEKVMARGRGAATWHMIGHIQTRKARRAAECADLIHSVDSFRLAKRLSGIAVDEGREVKVLCQVNTSGEGSKGGFSTDEAAERIHEVAELPGLGVRGLMTMAPFVEDESVLVAAFSGLRQIREQVTSACKAVGPELSMGMTGDLDIAIREGSTIVRIGTALFGPRTGGLG